MRAARRAARISIGARSDAVTSELHRGLALSEPAARSSCTSAVVRSSLVPINRRYPLDALMQAVKDYINETNRRVSFEYVLLQGQNDTPELAAELAELVSGMLCHVNLIPWNPVPGAPLERSHRRRVNAFQQVLVDRGIACTVRVERGVEIAAACGQLAALPEPRQELVLTP